MHHTHTTDIHVLRSCPYTDGRGLIALGGDYSVDILMAVRYILHRKARSKISKGLLANSRYCFISCRLKNNCSGMVTCISVTEL